MLRSANRLAFGARLPQRFASLLSTVLCHGAPRAALPGGFLRRAGGGGLGGLVRRARGRAPAV